MPLGWGHKDKPSLDTRQLDAFDRALPPDAGSIGPAAGWGENDTRSLLGRDVPLFTLFMAERAHSSVAGGLLRFLLPASKPSIQQMNGRDGWHSDWPSVLDGAVFASDWMGRLYFVARGKTLPNGEPSVALLEPAIGTAEALELSFGEFLGDALAARWRELLDVDRLAAWRASGGAVPGSDQCVTPKMPLFLGGTDDPSGLEMSPLVVAVSFAGQIREQVRNLPPGTPITGITLR